MIEAIASSSRRILPREGRLEVCIPVGEVRVMFQEVLRLVEEVEQAAIQVAEEEMDEMT